MAKIDYYAEVFDKYRYEIRNTWKTIRNLIGTTNDKTTIVGNNTISDIGQIADNCCNFLANVGPTYANKFRNQLNLMIFISNYIEQGTIRHFF